MRFALPLAAAIAVTALAGPPAAHAGPVASPQDLLRPGLTPTFQHAPEGTKTARVVYRGTCRYALCRYELQTADGSARAKDGDYRRRIVRSYATDGQRVEFAIRVVVRADAIDEPDERFFVDLTQERLDATTTTVVRRARATLLIPGVFVRERPCTVCSDRVLTPSPGVPTPDPGPQAAPLPQADGPVAASPQLEDAASPQPEQPSSPAPGTDDPAPSYDPAHALRVERLTGTSVSGAASAGPVVR